MPKLALSLSFGLLMRRGRLQKQEDEEFFHICQECFCNIGQIGVCAYRGLKESISRRNDPAKYFGARWIRRIFVLAKRKARKHPVSFRKTGL
jgi:hypothetical protein